MNSPAFPFPLPGLDAAVVARLVQLDPSGRLGVMRRIFSTYETTARRLGEQLEAQRQARQPEELVRSVHSLKSSSGSIGALGLQRCCQQLEGRVRSGERIDWDAEIDAVESELAIVLASVRAMLATL